MHTYIEKKLLPYLENRTTSVCKVLALFVSHFCSNILTGKATGALLVEAGLGWSHISGQTPPA